MSRGWWVVLLMMMAGCQGAPEPSVVADVVREQHTRYPAMQAQDWYKLFHQAAMGNEHLGADPALVRAYLDEEWSRVEAGSSEPLVEFIAPDSQIVRLNLRPYKALGGSPDLLFAAMQHTANTVEPRPERLEAWWQVLRTQARYTPGLPDALELDALIERQRASGWPALHHSEPYEADYEPQYRVLDGECLQMLNLAELNVLSR